MVLLAFIFVPLAIGLGFGLAALRGGAEQRPGFNGRPSSDRWTL
jgi:hypothetical protein